MCIPIPKNQTAIYPSSLRCSSKSHFEKLLNESSFFKNKQASLPFLISQIQLFKSFICGEYRSRTDDLLRARQAL